jgi:hypothetical protein
VRFILFPSASYLTISLRGLGQALLAEPLNCVLKTLMMEHQSTKSAVFLFLAALALAQKPTRHSVKGAKSIVSLFLEHLVRLWLLRCQGEKRWVRFVFWRQIHDEVVREFRIF